MMGLSETLADVLTRLSTTLMGSPRRGPNEELLKLSEESLKSINYAV